MADPCEVEELKKSEKIERDHPDYEDPFRLSKSSSSCKIDDIIGIVFGGTSTRFWMLRKHMNTITPQEYKVMDVPFYAWQCITLQLRHRMVDLVIKNQQDMDDFLMILIDGMKTVDGNKNSLQTAENHIIK